MVSSAASLVCGASVHGRYGGAGAVWDVWRREDATGLSLFLAAHSSEFSHQGAPAGACPAAASGAAAGGTDSGHRSGVNSPPADASGAACGCCAACAARSGGTGGGACVACVAKMEPVVSQRYMLAARHRKALLSERGACRARQGTGVSCCRVRRHGVLNRHSDP
jgi:hypothetical protein